MIQSSVKFERAVGWMSKGRFSMRGCVAYCCRGSPFSFAAGGSRIRTLGPRGGIALWRRADEELELLATNACWLGISLGIAGPGDFKALMNPGKPAASGISLLVRCCMADSTNIQSAL
jgi:hypothetical protein